MHAAVFASAPCPVPDQLDELLSPIATVMADFAIHTGKKQLEGWDVEKHASSGGDLPGNEAQCTIIVFDMFKNIQ